MPVGAERGWGFWFQSSPAPAQTPKTTMATTRPNGKGDRPRKVDGPKYRDNYDSIDWGIPKDWDYPEGSKTKEQRIAAMEYAAELGMWPQNPETQ